MNIEQERADFEAWHTEAFWNPIFDDEEDCFIPRIVQSRYEAYQAGRAALQSQDREDGFSDGVLLALQMMTGAGDAGSHLYFDLIKTAGIEQIVRRALKEDMWELAGLEAPMTASQREAIDHARRIEGEL